MTHPSECHRCCFTCHTPAERSYVLRLVILLLLVLTIGAPIWLVLNSEQPQALKATQLDIRDLFDNASSPNANEISVYSQASYANPATGLNAGPAWDSDLSQRGAIPNILSNRAQQPIFVQPPAILPGVTSVPDEAFQAMSGQTVVFPGTASGPDLSATPMQFIPTVDLSAVFRFDISPGWVRNRWEYVSTSPGDVGLHGLRVGLVTGTNISDLAGSLTYYFDENQVCQRITFRGWSGDSSKLVALLSQKYEFKPQPSQIAGLFLAERKKIPGGALLMKYPPVVSSQNRARQLGMELEMNNPQGPFSLSTRFLSMVEVAR